MSNTKTHKEIRSHILFKEKDRQYESCKIANSRLGEEIAICHNTIQVLREKIEHLEEQLNPKL